MFFSAFSLLYECGALFLSAVHRVRIMGRSRVTVEVSVDCVQPSQPTLILRPVRLYASPRKV